MLLIILMSHSLHAQFFNELFSITNTTRPYFTFIADSKHVPDKDQARSDIITSLAADGIILGPNPNRSLQFGTNRVEIPSEIMLHHFSDEGDDIHLIFMACIDSCDLVELFRNTVDHVTWHTGSWSRHEIQAIQVRVEKNTNHFVLLNTGREIIAVSQRLPFPIPESPADLVRSQQEEILASARNIHTMMKAVSDHVVDPDAQIRSPKSPDEQLSAEERLYGLSQFWSQVKYNFAFFHQVPDLDWDLEYQRLIPEVLADQSNYEYYRKLERFCALLNDGHTNIYMPRGLNPNNFQPPIKLKHLEDKVVIVDVGTESGFNEWRGGYITHINGQPVFEYMEEHITPYISTSADHIKRNRSVQRMLLGKENSQVTLNITDRLGTNTELTLDRIDVNEIEWTMPSQKWQLVDTATHQNFIHIELNSFGTTRIIDAFVDLIPAIQESEGVIIDLRKNGGGNSNNGYEILRYFLKEPVLTSKWSTRQHRPANMAWGISLTGKRSESLHMNGENLTDSERENWSYARGTRWHESSPDTLHPNDSLILDKPLVVLIGNNTASAAEDFLVAASGQDNITFIGQPTFGSTGQPVFMDLPAGGRARICTKKDTYPNGKEFVGYGIQPHIAVEQTIDSYLDQIDITLARAIELFED